MLKKLILDTRATLVYHKRYTNEIIISTLMYAMYTTVSVRPILHNGSKIRYT